MRLSSIPIFAVWASAVLVAQGAIAGHAQSLAPGISNVSPTTNISMADNPGSIPSLLFPRTPRLAVKTKPVDDGPPATGKTAAEKTAREKRLDFNTTIEVMASQSTAGTTEGFERLISPREVETAAGTFGDPSRYVQMMAGVVGDNDERNDYLVRGGNPSENGFVIDNIEIPSINQLAVSDTSGGLVSMLDAAAIHQLNLHTDAYDSKFDQRLSSVIEISTRPPGSVESHSEAELGFAGLGGSSTRPFGRDGSLFYSGRQSVLQYVTDNIGMDGVPIYRNAFVRAENRIDDRNNWWGISLTGIDSIKIVPAATDTAETNPYNVSYSGWRNTTGINWQHLFSSRSFGVASLAHAAQSQSIVETDQLQSDAAVYNEHTSDEITTFKYDWTFQLNKSITITAGTRNSVDQLNYSVLQPLGLQNPYSENPAPLDAMTMDRQFATVSNAAYVQAVFDLPHSARLVLGERAMQWSLGGHTGTTGKALLSLPIFGKLAHIGYSEYEQLPATLYLLSFDNLHSLLPIRSRQLTSGVTLTDSRMAKVMVEAYQKWYLDYPVATDYPQLSMANIADTFGQAFLMFPMEGKGSGLARGAELTVQTHPASRLDVNLAAAYSRNWYSGLDGILRRGNYDIPLSANISSVWRIKRSLTLSGRYSIASGRLYTPDNMPLSIAQDRDVYDLSQINGARSTPYHRLDFRFEQKIQVRRGTLTWYAGLQNALDSKNFYSEEWEPRSGQPSEQDQMPLFPDGGMKYSF